MMSIRNSNHAVRVGLWLSFCASVGVSCQGTMPGGPDTVNTNGTVGSQQSPQTNPVGNRGDGLYVVNGGDGTPGTMPITQPGTTPATPPGTSSEPCTPSQTFPTKATDTPNYYQYDIPGQANFCGPTAVSNSLMWLDDHGFSNISSNSANRKADQHALIDTLASPTYMNTVSTADSGTVPYRLATGVERFVASSARGYQGRARWQGWQFFIEYDVDKPADPTTLARINTGIAVPELSFIRNGVEGVNSAWLLLVGAQQSGNGNYSVGSGHWVTVVGHGRKANGQADPNALAVLDPRRPYGSAPIYVTVQNLTSGTMTVSYPGAPAVSQSASGFPTLQGFPNLAGGPITIVAGVVAFLLDPKCN